MPCHCGIPQNLMACRAQLQKDYLPLEVCDVTANKSLALSKYSVNICRMTEYNLSKGSAEPKGNSSHYKVTSLGLENPSYFGLLLKCRPSLHCLHFILFFIF